MSSGSKTSQSRTDTIFDIRPAPVKKWVEELPLGSTGESSKLIYHALKQINQQNNDLEHHLEFLQIITPTLILLYPRLSKYFTDISLPLNNKTRNVIHITNSLLNETLISFQTLIKKLSSEKPFSWKKPFSLAIHHSFIFSSQILCTQRLSYQPSPKGAWRDIFWAYQQAEKLNLLNKCFSNNSSSKDKTSIEFEFKRLLLLSLLSANDLSQNNMQEVHNLMPLWIQSCDLLTKEADDKKTCFTLNLLSDAPPYLIGTRNDSYKQTMDRHYLSTLRLKNTLTNYLSKIENDGAIRLGTDILSKTTIQSLLSTWSRNNVRTSSREKGTGFVDIITGISAIHFVLNQQDQPSHDEVSTDQSLDVVDFESTLTIEPLNYTSKNATLNLEHFLGNSDQDEDVWGKVYENSINTSIAPAHWTDSGIHQVFNFSKSILLDYSKKGYRLSVNINSIDGLKHNELVAIREHALAPWVLTQAKWLHFSEKGDVQFGIKILSRHVLPVHVCYQANNSLSKPLPSLLGLDKSKLILFVPSLPTNLNGKKLQLDHQNQSSYIHLKNKILTTPAFDAYEILESQTNEADSSQDLEKSKPNKQTTKPTILSDNIWKNF